MSSLSIRLPEDKHARLRQMAKQPSLSMSNLIEDLFTSSIGESEAESGFRAMAARGSVKK